MPRAIEPVQPTRLEISIGHTNRGLFLGVGVKALITDDLAALALTVYVTLARLDRTAVLSPNTARAKVEITATRGRSGWMVGRVPRWVSNAFRPGLDLPTPMRYRFDVQKPVPVQEDFLVKGDSFQADPVGSEPADVTFHCNTGTYILLIYGRLAVEGAIAAGRLTVDGSREQAANFTAWFQGF